jgi:hypothetical protein
MSKYVFELAEITPEMYFSQGIFDTQSDAIDAIKSDYPHCEACEEVHWEIRQRTVGAIGHGNYTVTAKAIYDSILESLIVKETQDA